MSKVQNLIAKRLGQSTFDSPSVPVSFRCSVETAVKMDVILKYLGYSNRSKFLSEILPAALSDALNQFSDNDLAAISFEVSKEMDNQYEIYAMENREP